MNTPASIRDHSWACCPALVAMIAPTLGNRARLRRSTTAARVASATGTLTASPASSSGPRAPTIAPALQASMIRCTAGASSAGRISSKRTALVSARSNSARNGSPEASLLPWPLNTR